MYLTHFALAGFMKTLSVFGEFSMSHTDFYTMWLQRTHGIKHMFYNSSVLQFLLFHFSFLE